MRKIELQNSLIASKYLIYISDIFKILSPPICIEFYSFLNPVWEIIIISLDLMIEHTIFCYQIHDNFWISTFGLLALLNVIFLVIFIFSLILPCFSSYCGNIFREDSFLGRQDILNPSSATQNILESSLDFMLLLHARH